MLVNPQYFREPALHYIKYKYYNNAPVGSYEFNEYWSLQKKYCKEGIKVGDTWIPGKMYFYLNFFPILKVPSKQDKASNKISATTIKQVGFADFWEVQLEWWLAKHIAWYGSVYNEKDKNHYIKPFEKSENLVKVYKSNMSSLLNESYNGGQHIVCAKTRGCGFSYMDAAEGAYNYNFIPKSKSFYLASNEGYLTDSKDGILPKVWDALEHLNQNTNSYWKKQAQEINNKLHRKASYITKDNEKKGYKSEVIGILVDESRKVRGARGLKITLEEFGSFPNALSVLDALLPLVEQGGYITGQISAFGTGGEKDANYIEGLETLFYQPSAYGQNGFMPFNNIWEAGGDTCGYFVPAFRATDKFFDDNGVCDSEAAKDFWNEQFEKRRRLKKSEELQKIKAERPFEPSDVFNRNVDNVLPALEAKEQYQKIKLSRLIQSNILYGDIQKKSKDKYEFVVTEDLPILDFPHKNNDDLKGCVTIFEQPYKDEYGQIPENLYFITVDPYAIDDAQDRTSLWVAYVHKREFNLSETFGDCIVASYIGRPRLLDECYKKTEGLSELYNCKIQSEIQGGGKALFDYFKNNQKLHKLEQEPLILSDNKETNVVRNRKYFMDTPTKVKLDGLLYFREWLLKPYTITDDGQELLNINKIKDLALLKEIMTFKLDGNYDRISAMIIAMFMYKEKETQEIELFKDKIKALDTNSYFNRRLFTDNNESSEETLSFF